MKSDGCSILSILSPACAELAKAMADAKSILADGRGFWLGSCRELWL